MAAELTPGMLADLFGKLALQGEERAVAALTATALAVERQAKINASNGEHAYRTRTPASPGQGPARISGSLVRAITQTEPRRTAYGWEVRVGMAPGLYPYYNRRTSSSQYGYILEVLGAGKSGHKFPFMQPAFHMVITVSVYTIFGAALGIPWGVRGL